MSRLLFANFSRLFKSWVFRFGLIINAFLIIDAELSRYFDMKEHPDVFEKLGVEYKSADGLAFTGGVFTVFVLAVVVASFIGTEYSEGTIRNKLMVGHKRGAIYLANFITCAAAGIMLLLCFLVVCYVFGALLFPDSYLTFGERISYTLMECLTMIALSAILVFIAMLIHSKSAGAVTALLMVFVMLFAVLALEDKLSEPEFYGDGAATYVEATVIDPETGEVTFVDRSGEPNPYYIGGTKRVILQTVYDVLPLGQCFNVMVGESDKIPIMSAYSLGIIVVFSGAGLILFRKKNIK